MVESDILLWKYFQLDRFLETLSSGLIYFAAADEFKDRFEGAVAVQTDAPTADPRYAEMEHSERAFFELKRLTKISCWHKASYESDAMWKLYAGEHKGIGLCTTPARMRKAFKPFRLRSDYGEETLMFGPVKYVDLTTVRLKGISMLHRFFIKHLAFEWEHEVRLAVSLRSAEEYGIEVPKKGIFLEVDLSILIEHIVLGTTISSEERALVGKQAERLGFGDRVRLSTLLGRPRYM